MGGFLGVKMGILPLGRCAPKKRTEAKGELTGVKKVF